MNRIIAMVGALATLLIASPTADAAFRYYSPVDPQKVDFVVNCFKVKTGKIDPIVFPGTLGMSHDHIFAGNLGVNQSSTALSLSRSGTNCEMSRNRSSYWSPRVFANGVPVDPGQDRFEFRIYYRAGTTNVRSVQPIPFGLKIVAGDPMATASRPQSAGIAGWQCRNLTRGNTVPKQNTPPNCPRGDYLEASVVFPNCWDGRNLDSANHRSHMAYAKATAACPSTHPVRLPQVTIAQRFPTNAFLNKTVTVASMGTAANSRYSLHADSFFAWDPATMKMLVEQCIRKSIGCEGVRDDRLPPGTRLPAATWPTS